MASHSQLVLVYHGPLLSHLLGVSELNHLLFQYGEKIQNLKILEIPYPKNTCRACRTSNLGCTCTHAHQKHDGGKYLQCMARHLFSKLILAILDVSWHGRKLGIIGVNNMQIMKISFYLWLAPFPVIVANEGLGWDPLLKM